MLIMGIHMDLGPSVTDHQYVARGSFGTITTDFNDTESFKILDVERSGCTVVLGPTLRNAVRCVSACLPTCMQTCNNMQHLHPATVLLIVKQTREDVINN